MAEWTPVSPLLDDAPTAASAFLEPHAFKVGDRVRVRLNGECLFAHLGNAHLTATYTLRDAIADGTLGGPGFMGANGAVGIIQYVCRPEGDDDDGHPYLVSDTDPSTGHWVQVDDFFAATELEPA